MFNVCYDCGEYRVDKTIVTTSEGSYAICPVCRFEHAFVRLPLFIVTGASGSGKSACTPHLTALAKQYIVLETDILWEDRYNTPSDDYRTYRELWLRLAKNISQNGTPVILSGTALPNQMEPCLERRYFSEIHYLALGCSAGEMRTRLQQRPSWRNSHDETFIENMVTLNQWFRENASQANSQLTFLDTTNHAPEGTARQILDWADHRQYQDRDAF